jgi:uncharacterized protein with FMN-binding domain
MPSETSTRPVTPGQRVSRGLVALSSAVVLAVYSAGYLRTQAAADRFAAEADQRRPLVPAPVPADPAPSTPPVTRSASVAPVSAPDPVATAGTAAWVTPAPAAVVRTAASATSKAAPAATPVATTSPAPSAPSAAAPVPAETPAAKAAPEGAPVATTASAPAAVPTVAVAPTTPPAPRYKDGTHRGWGTSRHGDIEAQVTIVNGRITSATISQCMTRWPCSWVEALPGQVVARQSAETDYVSGATQSTNAFYYAVVQALGKAALP